MADGTDDSSVIASSRRSAVSAVRAPVVVTYAYRKGLAELG
ncbi:hypothetical protein [Actinoallomurus iriomotensis]|nr:hypothetical protein [Actinoallomurus iriomotensis]